MRGCVISWNRIRIEAVRSSQLRWFALVCLVLANSSLFAAMQPTTLTKGRKEVKFNHQISVGVEVTGIWPSSELLGVVYVGDTIVSVNGMPTPYTAEFVRAVNSKLPGSVVIEYMRDEMCTIDFKQLPPKKQGYDLFEVTLIWRSGGTPIGLLIHRVRRVVVAMVESGCTASKVIKAGDVLVKVNSTEVKDRDIARKLIVASINTNKRVVLTLERCTFALMPPPLTKAPSDTGPQGAAAPSSAAPKPALTAPAVNTKVTTAASIYCPNSSQRYQSGDTG
ncbi:unnamed protein product [Heligmosomoides polygyrus]|uniref:PDZ domain-containing protein n=1 Tax=Heligmosomoides polygyrus TaxID=6339 RepID=A0A183F3H7_HELPZ|nr:unnamed protein product [Heligmosomoides polygyrus]